MPFWKWGPCFSHHTVGDALTRAIRVVHRQTPDPRGKLPPKRLMLSQLDKILSSTSGSTPPKMAMTTEAAISAEENVKGCPLCGRQGIDRRSVGVNTTLENSPPTPVTPANPPATAVSPPEAGIRSLGIENKAVPESKPEPEQERDRAESPQSNASGEILELDTPHVFTDTDATDAEDSAPATLWMNTLNKGNHMPTSLRTNIPALTDLILAWYPALDTEIPFRYLEAVPWRMFCGFCGSRHHLHQGCGEYTKYRKEYGMHIRDWPMCHYELCEYPRSHFTVSCPTLHHYCPECRFRGHPAKLCGRRTKEQFHLIYKDAHDPYLRRKGGRYTRRGERDILTMIEWSFHGPKKTVQELTEVKFEGRTILADWGERNKAKFEAANPKEKIKLMELEITR